MAMNERERMEKVVREREESDVTMRRGVATDIRPEMSDRPVTVEEMRTMIRGEVPGVTPRTWWLPITGGILSVLAGAWNVLVGLAAMISVPFISSLLTSLGFSTGIGIGVGALLFILGIVSIIGGAVAIRRRFWGLALAGSITSLVPSPVLFPMLFGVLSLVFVSLGKPEFRK